MPRANAQGPAARSTTGRVVALINMKGGVGKTTLAVGLAWRLAERGKKVLLVDTDPQFNATQWLMKIDDYLAWIGDARKRTVLDVFQPPRGTPSVAGRQRQGAPATASLRNAVVPIRHDRTTLDLVPSILDLIDLDSPPLGTENALNLFLAPARQVYDYILIDCPPTASLYSLSAYLASDAYLVPLKPDPLSILGVPLLERMIQRYHARTGHTARLLGVVLSLVRRTPAMNGAVADIRRDRGGQVFTAVLPQTTGVAEAVGANLPPQLFPKTRASFSPRLAEVCDEFETRIQQP